MLKWRCGGGTQVTHRVREKSCGEEPGHGQVWVEVWGMNQVMTRCEVWVEVWGRSQVMARCEVWVEVWGMN